MAKKILVAIDDSENGERAADFLAENFVRDLQITLFSVIPDTKALCNMDSPALTPYFKARQSNFCALEDQKKKIVREALEDAKEKLVGKGFSPDDITINIQTKKEDVAQDIVSEARTGFDLIIMGRRGLSQVREMFLGSISTKVIHLATDISVLIVN
jgi:nucleotide-binding universal stress UspA family protein